MYDITIVGAGPAGLTAAIYACRAGKSVMILEKATFGGQITFSPKIENYPGFDQISGNDLADKMVSQAMNLGAEIDLATVTGVEFNEAKKTFTVKTDSGDYESYAVILAAGAEHRKLGLPGEEELIGNGISFCAVCDGAFYAGKHVAVIGGGNSALVEASLLAETCSKITVVQNLSTLTGEKAACDALLAHENVTAIYDTVVDSYVSENGDLTALVLLNTKTGEKTELKVDGVFIAIGLAPANKPFENVATLDKWGYIEAGESCETGKAGVFVAGDCRTKRIRQVSTAAADGAIAALSACNYIDKVIFGK